MLKYRDLVRLPGFSVLSSQKTIEEINESKKQPLYKFLFGSKAFLQTLPCCKIDEVLSSIIAYSIIKASNQNDDEIALLSFAFSKLYFSAFS